MVVSRQQSSLPASVPQKYRTPRDFPPSRLDGRTAATPGLRTELPIGYKRDPLTTREIQQMGTITTKDGVAIFFKDWGAGQPIVFSHGWPLSSDDWDAQMMFFVNRGFRVIAHDRRGHGRSSQTADGHDMDHYADDLAALTSHLDLRNAVHVGHSTGGGEVAH